MLNFSEASERNKQVILQQLRDYLAPGQRVLEIGSGSGQHAVYFNSQIDGLEWQCTEMSANQPALAANLAAFAERSMPPPLALDVTDRRWGERACRSDLQRQYIAHHGLARG